MLIIGGIELNPGPTPPQDQLSIAHVNINSITAGDKKQELMQFVTTNNIMLCGLTETKLDDTVSTSLYKLDNYHAPLVRHRNRSGGGVALYAHSSLPIKRLKELEIGEEEWIWAKISLYKFSLVVCCIYLPPNQTTTRLQEFIDRMTESISLAQTYSPTAIMILGDFNTGNIYLDQTKYKHSGITTFDHQLNNAAKMLELEQIISQPTRITETANNLRDLIFTNNTDIINYSETLSAFSTLDHLPIIVSVRTTCPTPCPAPNTNVTFMTIWDYERLDSDLFTKLLLDTNWKQIIDNDVNIAAEQFTAAILSAAEVSIPHKSIAMKPSQKPWVTSEMIKQIRKRDRLFRRARQTQTTYDWDRWKYQRNIVTATNKRLKQIHIQGQIRKLLQHKQEPHKYHQTLRRLTGKTRDSIIPPLEGPDGKILADDYEKATLFNDYFANQAKLDIPITHTIPQNNIRHTSVPTLGVIETSEREVLRILNSLDANKSTGPDKIPVKILKLSALIIAEPLSKLFNKSLSTGIYPSIFKQANVKPIFKNNGSPSDYTCYRPISLLSSLSKVFEKIVHRRIYDHLTEHSLLTDKQSGYRRKHSTEQQLLYLTHNLYKALDSGNDFTAIYLDISKYFDKIWHVGLLHKCKHDFGITGILLSWLTSYLSDRQQRVQINNTFSSQQTVNAGCPQGSVLGPLLALMYLDGLQQKIDNDILLFADDTSLYASHTTLDIQKIELSLQRDLDEIYKYGREWAITFNTAKTVQQTFSRKQNHKAPQLTFGGDSVPFHENHTHLGLTFSKDLRFHHHVNKICKKVNTALSPLYPLARYIPRPILDQIYKTYIRPHFDYCDTVYDGHITTHDAMRLEKLQNRAGRLVTGTLFRTPTDKLLLDLGWDRLSTRRRIHKLTLYHAFSSQEQQMPSYIKNIMPHSRSNNTGRVLRNASTHTMTLSRTTSYHNSFFPLTAKHWNSLPQSIRSLPRKSFKKTITERLGVPKPPKFFETGSKMGNTLHTRIRTGMTHLNSHRFQIQRSETAMCACGHSSENVRHFILDCPLYRPQRLVMYQDISYILGIEFKEVSPKQKLNILINGETLDDESGCAVARHFQKFLVKSNRVHDNQISL